MSLKLLHSLDFFSFSHGNAAIGVPFVSVQNSMYRWRNAHVPPVPHSLRSYVDVLNTEQWNTFCRYEEGSLQFSLAPGRENTSVIILDPNFVRVLLQNREFYLHISKKVVPAAIGAVQLLTIMSSWNSYVSIMKNIFSNLFFLFLFNVI